MSERRSLESFTCAICGKSYPEVEPYSQNRGGKHYMRPLCKQCDNHRRRDYGFSPQSKEAALASSRKYQKSLRTSSDFRKMAIVISSDCKSGDRQKGRGKNDMTSEAAYHLIKNGCCYCGDTESRMTLDRIDNTKPHNQDNVVPACLRCNLTRGGMPYEAWLLVSVNMKAAREQGLFGSWDGRLGGNTEMPG